MITLDRLKEMGAIAASLMEVSMLGISHADYSDVAAMTEEEQSRMHKIVTVDNPVWIATSKGRPAQEAVTVYSCNESGDIGCWKSKQHTFLQMELSNSQLQTKNIIRIKEETSMARLGMDEDFSAMSAFDSDALKGELGGSTKTEEKAGSGTKASDIGQRLLDGIQKSGLRAQIIKNDKAVVNNHAHGRLIGFITKTNSAVMPKKKNMPKLDANQHRVIDPAQKEQMPDEIKKKYAEKGNYPMKYCQKEAAIEFANTRPGSIVGIIVATPVCSNIALTDIHNNGAVFDFDASNQDLGYHIMGLESAYVYLATNYNGRIKESEEVMGARASEVEVLLRTVSKENKEGTQKKDGIKPSLVLANKDIRKNLVVTGNYFPAKIYETTDVSNIDSEKAVMLNYYFDGMMAKSGVYESLCEESKADVQYNPETKQCTSSWFNNGKKIQVKKFDAESDSDFVSDVRIPVKTKSINPKDSSKVSYKFVYRQAGEEGGPQEIDCFKRIMDAVKIEPDEFYSRVNRLVARKGNKSKKSGSTITSSDFLAMLGTSVDTGISMSLAQIQEEINGVY